MSIDKDFASRIKALANDMEIWNAKRDLYQPIISKLEALGSEPTFTAHLYAPLTGNRDKLIATIRALRTSGLKSTQIPREGQPQFSAWYCSEDQSVQVCLMFTSSVCRKVKVGTKTETVDVFEVQCGEESELIEQVAAQDATAIQNTRIVRERLAAGFSQRDAYRDLPDVNPLSESDDNVPF